VSPVVVRPDPVALAVAETAAASPDWTTLAGLARSCVACPDLAAARHTVVVGDVPAGGRPRFALIGEAPGATEDETGRPFVGRSGALLDQLLSEAGLARADAAVLNVVKCRPPGNRTPKAPEVARCSSWLDRQLQLLDPPVVVALGLSAATWFLGPRTVLGQVRGRPHDIGGRAVWATYHPSAALRFGPRGAPRAGLLADLTAVAGSLR
jgi:uracil-DNA glycosylase